MRFNSPTIKHHRTEKEILISPIIHKIVNRLIGAEIIDQKENLILIKYVTKETEEDFQVILRRIFLLLKETSSNLYKGVSKFNIPLLETIEEQHDIVNKFVNYCLRLINKYGYSDVKKTYYYFHIIASLDKIMDILKYSARAIVKENKKFSKISLNITKQFFLSIELYYKLFYSFSFKTVNQLSQNRDEVKKIIDNNMKEISKFELIQLTSYKSILELILDLTDFRMGLEN